MGFNSKFLISCLIGVVVLLGYVGITSVNAMETDDCLGCHGDSSIIDEGGKALYIDGAQFAGTAHAEEGCTACHSVTDDHPDDGVKPTTESCDTCHDDISAEYGDSPHAKNATCVDCHNPHKVKDPLALSGFDVDKKCAKCHEDVGHGDALPRPILHMQAVSCTTCHTDTKKFVVTFYLEKVDGVNVGNKNAINLATYADLRQLVGDKNKVQSIIDTDGDGLISLAELKKFNSNPQYKKLRLWGMLTTDTVSHQYGIFKNRQDCTFCHAAGPKAMQTSYVAFPKQDGTYSRVAVEKGAPLDMLFATPDFYVVGAGRNNILNIVGLLILAGGFGAALLHGTFRFLTRKNRRKH